MDPRNLQKMTRGHAKPLLVRGIARGRSIVYTPGIWRWSITIIRWIPEAVFVRLKL